MTTPEDDAGAPDPASAVEIERRAFVRRMSAETVGIAGRVFGLSKALNRGVMAGGQAMKDNLEAVALEQADAESILTAPLEPAAAPDPVVAPDSAPSSAPVVAAVAMAAATPAASPPPPKAAPPPVRLTDAQRSILAAATSAVVAVNGREGSPIAVPVPIHWDGETIRFGSLGWSRRSGAIRTDPRVTVVVEDAVSATFIAIEGHSEFIVGAGVREAMAPLLSRAGDAAEADGRWAELVAADADRVVVTVRPEKVLAGRL